MDNYRAVALAEGFEDGTDEERVEAWQHLVDTGLAWQLQGCFGRTAVALIEAGVIRDHPNPNTPDNSPSYLTEDEIAHRENY